MKNIKKFELPFKFVWPKRERRPTTSAQILINGKLIVFVFCSLVSAFINLVFISNLTKADYNIGTLIAVPAAVLLGLLSIGLDIGKFLLAIQVNTLSELIRKLSKFNWVGRVKRAAVWWRSVYITFIMLSVITSVSLSTISIGSGISRNANLISQIDEYIVEGEKYTSINAAAKDANFQAAISDATSTREAEARKYAEEKTGEVLAFIDKISPIVNGTYENEEAKRAALQPYENERAKINNILRNAGWRARTFDELVSFDTSSLQADIKAKQLEFLSDNTNKEATDKLNQLTDDTNDEVRAWLETLNALALTNPKTGEILEFSTEENKAATVLAKSALTLLKALRVDVENDSGDIGSSSKLFMQLGSAWDARHIGDRDLQAALNVKAKGSFGATEVMMMGMLLFLSLLCELLINLFSPKTNISRKMLSQFSEYFDSDFDVNDFMLGVYIDQLNFGVIDRELFDAKSKKAVELTQITKESLYEKYTKVKTVKPAKEKTDNKYKQQFEDQSKVVEDLKHLLDEQNKKNEELTNSILTKDDEVQSLKRELANKRVVTEKKERKIVEPEFSSAVDEKAKEIEALL